VHIWHTITLLQRSVISVLIDWWAVPFRWGSTKQKDGVTDSPALVESRSRRGRLHMSAKPNAPWLWCAKKSPTQLPVPTPESSHAMATTPGGNHGIPLNTYVAGTGNHVQTPSGLCAPGVNSPQPPFATYTTGNHPQPPQINGIQGTNNAHPTGTPTRFDQISVQIVKSYFPVVIILLGTVGTQMTFGIILTELPETNSDVLSKEDVRRLLTASWFMFMILVFEGFVAGLVGILYEESMMDGLFRKNKFLLFLAFVNNIILEAVSFGAFGCMAAAITAYTHPAVGAVSGILIGGGFFWTLVATGWYIVHWRRGESFRTWYCPSLNYKRITDEYGWGDMQV